MSILALSKSLDAICGIADPTRLAVNLYSHRLISDGTRDRAVNVTGMDNYHKNAEMMTEVEKMIKDDRTKLPALCEVLKRMPLLKKHGVNLEEAATSTDASAEPSSE